MSAGDPRAGFTLIEAAVALAILGVVAVGWLGAVAGQVSTAARASEVLTAVSLAEERMSALRLASLDDLDRVPDSLLAGRFPPPLDGYGWQSEVEPASPTDPGSSRLMALRVTVGWPGGEETLWTRAVLRSGTGSAVSPVAASVDRPGLLDGRVERGP